MQPFFSVLESEDGSSSRKAMKMADVKVEEAIYKLFMEKKMRWTATLRTHFM
jgi:hypothetical protein